jgi:hypothetical protein
MGLLFNREVFRLKSRRRAYFIAKYIISKFLFLVYFIGIFALLILPHDIAHNTAVADERALLIGQVIKC